MPVTFCGKNTTRVKRKGDYMSKSTRPMMRGSASGEKITSGKWISKSTYSRSDGSIVTDGNALVRSVTGRKRKATLLRTAERLVKKTA